MRKTFRLIAVAAAMLATSHANAQLGINIGYAPVTLTTQTTLGNSTSTSSTDMNGFFAGVNHNTDLGSGLGLSLGLQGRFNIKTSTGSANFIVVSGNDQTTTTQFLIDVPVLLNYGLDLGGGTMLTAFAGPTFSYALAGNTHVKTTTSLLGNTSTSENDYPMYGDNSNTNRFDICATFGLEFQYYDYRLFGGYRFGLIDLNTGDNVKTTSSGIFIGLGIAL